MRLLHSAFMAQSSLRALRERRGLTLEKLAHLSGVTMGTIRNLEGGETVPRLDTARAVASALSCTVDEAFPVIADEPEAVNS